MLPQRLCERTPNAETSNVIKFQHLSHAWRKKIRMNLDLIYVSLCVCIGILHVFNNITVNTNRDIYHFLSLISEYVCTCAYLLVTANHLDNKILAYN